MVKTLFTAFPSLTRRWHCIEALEEELDQKVITIMQSTTFY